MTTGHARPTSWTLHVGSIRIALHIPDPVFAAAVTARYRRFTDNRRADIHLDLFQLPERPRKGSRHELQMRLEGDQLQLSSALLEATLDLRARVGEIGVVPEAHFGGEPHVETALKHICQPIAVERGAFLLQAAGVVSRDGNEAQIFAGPAGAARTTQARLLRTSKWMPLADDLMLVETRADGCDVAVTPFGDTARDGAPGGPRRCAIEAIHLVEPGPNPSSAHGGAAGVASPSLFSRIPFTEALDDARRQSLLDAVSHVVSKVTVRRLVVGPGVSVLPVIGGEPAAVSKLELQPGFATRVTPRH